jgi:flavorubredoxin
MATIDEIAPDSYRISIYVPPLDMQFNHFLFRDAQPLLYHAGLRSFFPELLTAVGKLMDPGALRWIGWSHFESDECGALNQWLERAPEALPVCTMIGKLVSVDDFANRPARGMAQGEVLETGKHRFRFVSSPHIPHGWDAGLLFEETGRTLLCSDLFHHFGKVEALTQADVVGRTREAMAVLARGPLAGYMPYTPKTEAVLRQLSTLNPQTLAVMHGSSFNGNCEQALCDLAAVIQSAFGT